MIPLANSTLGTLTKSNSNSYVHIGPINTTI
jgi:hypothetical protein